MDEKARRDRAHYAGPVLRRSAYQ